MNTTLMSKILILACLVAPACIWSCNGDQGKTLIIPAGGGGTGTTGGIEDIEMAVVSYTEPGACTTYHAGELWYDSTALTLKICDNNAWKPTVGNPTALVGATEPFVCSSAYIGALWYNTADSALNICLASGWANASTEPGDTLTPCANCIIFVTSTKYNGDLGGLDGADEICNLRAAAGGLPGYYKALLSTGTVQARDHTRIRPDASFITTASLGVATSYDDLWDGSITNRIRDEFGALVSSEVHTGTLSTGYADPYHCAGWTSAGSDNGTYGSASATSSTWLDNTFSACSNTRCIYCVQWSED